MEFGIKAFIVAAIFFVKAILDLALFFAVNIINSIQKLFKR